VIASIVGVGAGAGVGTGVAAGAPAVGAETANRNGEARAAATMVRRKMGFTDGLSGCDSVGMFLIIN
jgi:hypothetical protein